MKKNKCIGILFLLLCSFTAASQDKEFTIKYKDGKIYRQGEFVTGVCGKVLQETTFDENGNMIRQEQWFKRKRCGTTKVYAKGKLVKEIGFKNNLIDSYTAYLGDKVYTHISSSRSSIINKGKPVKLPWTKYYIKIAHGKIAVLTKSKLVDAMRYFMLPEEISQAMEDISKYAGLTPVPGGNAILACGGKAQEISDANADFGSSDPEKKKEAESVSAGMGQSCAAATGSSLTSPIDNIAGGGAARAERNAKASSALDKMIENCSGSNLSSGGLVSVEPASTSTAVIVMQGLYKVAFDATASATARTAALAAADDLAIIIADAAVTTWTTSTVTVTAGSGGGAVLLGGFALPEILAGAAVVTVVVGTALVVIEVMDDEEANTTGSTPVTGGGSGESETGTSGSGNDGTGTSGTGSSGAGSSGTPSPNMPIPGMDSENGCDRLKSLKKYCDNNGWQDMRCQDAARVLGGCKGDVREILISPEGGIGGMGCPSAMSAEEIARLKCKAQGMVARPEPGGSVCRSTGQITGSIDDILKDPGYIDPVRGDFEVSFSGTEIKVASSSAMLNTMLQNAKRPTMVVFMNPDCSSCRSFTQSLKSKDMESTLKSMDVVVIDASAKPEVMAENRISAFPSFYVYKDGKKSMMTVGAMSGLETANYMNRFK